MHTALSGTLKAITENSHRLIKEQGRDPYDTTKASVISAMEKIEKMAQAGIKAAREAAEQEKDDAQ